MNSPSFKDAFRFWLKLGFISFGGPAGQIAIMHSELVEKRKWISDAQFLHALNFCMLLPGPEAQQLAIYIGWLLHRTWGGIVAGVLFVLPSAFILLGLSYIYMTWEKLAAVSAVFDGLKPAVLAIVLVAVLRIGKKALKNRFMWVISALAFIGIFFFAVPFPLIILCAAMIGFAGNRFAPEKFQLMKGHGSNSESASLEDLVMHTAPSWGRLCKVSLICLSLWWAPLLLVGVWLGWQGVHFQMAWFFSKAAMVTFGGAYAVLPYVSQQAVEHFHWLAPGQMLDGLALAETTPGPLIMVLQFVGFIGAWNSPGSFFTPLQSAILGAGITTWATFLPCFFWVFLGAPYIERLRENRNLNAALSTITAAVVGVILNLAVWFGYHVLLPSGQPVNGWGIAIAVVTFLGMQRWKWDTVPVVIGAAVLGLARLWLA